MGEVNDPIKLMEETANMLRGMTLDPAIPRHAKGAMESQIAKLERCVEQHLDDMNDESDLT